MKTFALAFILIFSLVLNAQNSITVSWQFKNIEQGFDHQNKIVIYIDNHPVIESETFLESQLGILRLNLNSDRYYQVKIVNYAWLDGEWEEHLKANKYSIDCIYEKKVKLKKNKGGNLNLTFDFKNDKMKIKSKNIRSKRIRNKFNA